MLRRLSLLFILAVLFAFDSIPLHSDNYSLNIVGNQFIISTPIDWTLSDAKEPLDYKLIHKSGTRECYLLLSCFQDFDSSDSGDFLDGEMIDALEALYGEEFWEKSNFSISAIHNDKKDIHAWFFTWDAGDVIESGYVRADTKFTSSSPCTTCIVLIEKINKSHFNPDKQYENLVEDYKTIMSNLLFFKK